MSVWEEFEVLVNQATTLWSFGEDDYRQGVVDLVLTRTGLPVAEESLAKATWLLVEHAVGTEPVSDFEVAAAKRLVRSALTAVTVTVLAEYQVFGDVDGAEWMGQVLERAVNEDRITSFAVGCSVTVPSGVRVVSFSVDVDLDAEQAELTYPELKDRVTALLNEVIGDTDVQVRALGLRS